MMELSRVAAKILERLREQPDRLRYDTAPLGGMFREGDLAILDMAYEELREAGFVEPTPDYVSFFGTPKRLYRLTERGRNQVVSAP